MSLFYQQIIVLELHKFIEQDETIVQANAKSKNSPEDYTLEISASLKAFRLIIPMLKNNDPTTPVWVIRCRELSLKPVKERIMQPMNITVIVDHLDLEVSL